MSLRVRVVSGKQGETETKLCRCLECVSVNVIQRLRRSRQKCANALVYECRYEHLGLRLRILYFVRRDAC